MDSSWFLELDGVQLLIDPWLEGEEIDFARWFNCQWHQTPPMDYTKLPPYQAVLITQKYPDHCHLPTMVKLQPAHVIAPISLHRKLRRHLPAARLDFFSPTHRRIRLDRISLEQLPTRRRLAPIYDAYWLTGMSQTLLLANHGLSLDRQHLEQMGQREVNVLMSPFNRYCLPKLMGGLVSPGLMGLEQLLHQTQAKHVIPTHDELKHASGIVSKLAQIEPFEAHKGVLPSWLAAKYFPIQDYQTVNL